MIMNRARTPLLLLVVSTLAACGGNDDSATTELTVEFPGTFAEGSTNSLHFWVLEPRPRDPETEIVPGCLELQLGDASPYDLDFARHADLVVVTAEGTGVSAENLPARQALIYVEGVNFVGAVAVVGCESVDLAAAGGAVTIPLRRRGALDCAKPETPEGADCDDGLFCTAGETCRAGQCQGGGPRDCTHVADACNAESCDEAIGCAPLAVPNGTPCSDGLTCTAGDTCQVGACEPGGARDCTSLDDDCNVGMCFEGTNCQAVPTNADGPCQTTCATTGVCDAFGACLEVEGPNGDATCSDGEDNDCDTFIDVDDPDCAAA